MTLRARVLAGFLAIAVLLGVAGFLVISSTSKYLLTQVDSMLVAAKQPLGDLDRAGGMPPYPDGAPPRLSAVSVTEIDAAGNQRQLVVSDLPGATDPPIDVERCRWAAESGLPYTLVDGEGNRFRFVAYEVADSAIRVVSLPLGDVDAALSRLALVMAIGALGILAALALVAWWVIRLGIRPIKQMTATAAAIAGGDLTHRVPEAPAKTEAGELGRSLNAMLASIEAAFDARGRSEQRLRRFAADASHELRTPVTTIRGYAELYRAGGLRDPDELGEAMRRTESEAVRMGRLVDDLLLLARLDQGRALERAAVDLTQLAADAAVDAAVRDTEREISGPDDTKAVRVLGDADRLRQVVSNLVGNALVHTPPGSPVSVSVRREGHRGILEVTDRGEGMPAEVEQRAFERFYRSDPARSRHHGGSGLGLSIVESIVTALDGTVQLRNVAGQGLTASISLPLAT